MVERLRTLWSSPLKGDGGLSMAALTVEHLKVLLVEHLKVLNSRACLRILISRACLRILSWRPNNPRVKEGHQLKARLPFQPRLLCSFPTARAYFKRTPEGWMDGGTSLPNTAYCPLPLLTFLTPPTLFCWAHTTQLLTWNSHPSLPHTAYCLPSYPLPLQPQVFRGERTYPTAFFKRPNGEAISWISLKRPLASISTRTEIRFSTAFHFLYAHFLYWNYHKWEPVIHYICNYAAEHQMGFQSLAIEWKRSAQIDGR